MARTGKKNSMIYHGVEVPPETASLAEEVDAVRRQIRTDGYAMSVGELASLYEEGELEIQPKFQRFFRWNDNQKTSLIESILLGIPLPQIFVSQKPDGIWEVVDGLQRLSTLFEFMGKLRGEDGNCRDPLRLTEAKYLPTLRGLCWSDLPQPLRIDFRRSKINMSIILRGGDQRAKYDLFQRLNTGGSPLSYQEVRNCILVMENEKFYGWLKELSEIASFQECVPITNRLRNEGYHMELASRFLIFSSVTVDTLKGDLGPFITDNIIDIAQELDDSDLARRSETFRDTFSALHVPILGESAFKKYSPQENRFRGPFLISAFEAIACGIAFHLARGCSVAQFPAEIVASKIRGMWSNGQFADIAQRHQAASYRLNSTIPYGRELFDPGNPSC